MDVALVLTHACNLACSYCYTGEKKRVRMPLELAERALDFAFVQASTQASSALTIEFFGGEPLLEWELVCNLAAQARARAHAEHRPLALQLTTNGTLLDAERLAVLQELRVQLALSLDGSAESQDRGRPLAGGGASSPAVFRALSLLLEAEQPFDVISVVTPENVAELSLGVRDLLDRGVSRLTLNPHFGGDWTAEKRALAEQQYEGVAALLLAWFRRGRAVVVQPFDSAILTLASGAVASCAAGERSFAVAPSGRIYGCARSVGEDTGARAIGDLERGVRSCSQRTAACACACAEETGDAEVVGPVQAWHSALVAGLAARIVRALRLDAEGEAFYGATFLPKASRSSA